MSWFYKKDIWSIKRMEKAKAYSKSCQTSLRQRFAKIVNGSKPFSRQLFSQNAPFQMFDTVLNTPLETVSQGLSMYLRYLNQDKSVCIRELARRYKQLSIPTIWRHLIKVVKAHPMDKCNRDGLKNNYYCIVICT